MGNTFKISNVLETAVSIRKERQEGYGDAVTDFKKISKMASLMVGKELSPTDCCKVLIAVKLMRESYKHKDDNLIDLCGYTDILQLLEEDKLNE